MSTIYLSRRGSGATASLVLGETLWSHSSSFGGNASILSPLLQVPDTDGDGTPDLLILAREGQEVSSTVLKSPRPTGLLVPSLLPRPLLPRESSCDYPAGVPPRTLCPEVHTCGMLGGSASAGSLLAFPMSGRMHTAYVWVGVSFGPMPPRLCNTVTQAPCWSLSSKYFFSRPKDC